MKTRAFRQPISYTPPGGPAMVIGGDLYRRGRNIDPGMDDEGGLVTDWVLMTGPDVVPVPLGEVVHPHTGEILWVHGYPDVVSSLLRGGVDHVETKCKTVYRMRTTVDIWRDTDTTDTNDLGDPVDSPATPPPERSGVEASIVEVSQVLPTDTDLRTLSTWVGWVAAGTDVRRGDRLKVVQPSDGGHPPVGALFRVEGVTQPVEFGLREQRLELARTT